MPYKTLLIKSSFFCILYSSQIPSGFIYVNDFIPSIMVDMKYYSNNNFIGKKINGYRANKCIITIEAALALKQVQQELKHFGYGLKIFDGYRPQKAVNQFVNWSKNSNKTRKHIHYPDIDKKHLFKKGYISSKSGHSRGSTVDVTIIKLEDLQEIDMGTIYDYFGKESSIDYSDLNWQQINNRLLLQSVMKKFGFKNLKEEWWHFTLINEPFPDKYYNFDIN